MLKSIALACALVLAVATTARAAEETAPGASADAAPTAAPSADPTPGWTFDVVPYGWGVRLSGRSAAFGFPEAPINVGRVDLLEHFRAGVMLGAEARHDRLLFFGDVFAVRVDGLSTPVNATSRVDEIIATLGAGYTVVQRPNYRLDVVAGARLWSTNNKLTFHGGPLDGHTLSDGDTWLDPFVGLRGHVDFTPRLYAVGWFEIGGGLGSGSDRMWDVMAGAGYRLNRRVSMLAGYRGASVDRRHGAFVYDTYQQGPYAGLVVRF